MFCIAGETLQVYFLGTAGALPTPNRNPACIMIRHGSDTLMFDCGEGTQQQMMRSKSGFTLDAIFVTHWHADHYLGIPGLIQTLSFMGREDPLTIYGPRGVNKFVDIVRELAKNNLKFSLHASELAPGSVVPFNGYHVEAFDTDHGIVSLGYILTEDSRLGRFDRDHAIELGVPPGPLFGRLQRGEAVTLIRDGVEHEIQPAEVVGSPRPGRTVVYTGDTRPCYGEWMKSAKEADLLIHDATFDDSEPGRAVEVFHSTAGEAGAVAEAINAQRLALVHISSRYTSMTTHIQDAKKSYTGEVIAPDDRMTIELPFRG